jgi:hypothetical protein
MAWARMLLVGGVLAAGAFALLGGSGCTNTPVDAYTNDYAVGPVPLRQPSPAGAEGCSYEDSLTGGEIFTMYCAYCHQARPLAERPFSNYKNVAAHMRVRANLTGKEYAKLQAWLRRWHDVPPPANPPIEESPKRLIFSQPISELKPQDEKQGGAGAPGGAPQPPEPKP